MSPITLRGGSIKKKGAGPQESVSVEAKPLDPAKKVCQQAIPPVPVGDCEYYQRRHDNFIERHEGCPHLPPDYYLRYGKKYCVRFSTALRPKLTPLGKTWLDRARFNLQRRIEMDLPKQPELELDNDRFRTFAFSTHADAYWAAGLHELPIGDKLKIGATPDAKEWLSGSTWKQAGDVAIRDAGAYAKDAANAVDEAATAVEDTARKTAAKMQQAAADIVEYFREVLK